MSLGIIITALVLFMVWVTPFIVGFVAVGLVLWVLWMLIRYSIPLLIIVVKLVFIGWVLFMIIMVPAYWTNSPAAHKFTCVILSPMTGDTCQSQDDAVRKSFKEKGIE